MASMALSLCACLPEEVAAVPAKAQLSDGGHVHDAVVEEGCQAGHPAADEDQVLVHGAACQLAGHPPHLLADEGHHLQPALSVSNLPGSWSHR